MTKSTTILLDECGKKHRDQEVLPSKLVISIAMKRCMVKFHSRKISFREPPAFMIKKQLLLPTVIVTPMLITSLEVLEQMSRTIRVHRIALFFPKNEKIC